MLGASVPLVVDEAYLLAVSGPFQLSFFDHPPLAFWIVTALQALFGPDLPPLVLRLPFIALGTGAIWLMFRLGTRLHGDWAGAWGAFFFACAPFFLVSSGSWLVPDGPLIFFLLLGANLLARIAVEGDTRWITWLGLGAAFGLAALSKYHAVLVFAGAGLYLLATPHRRLLLTPKPWAALGIVALIFLPVVVWNAQHDWASFAFQLGRGAAAGRFDPMLLAYSLGGQGLYLLPWTLLGLLAAAIAMAGAPGLRPRTALLLALGLPGVLAFNGLALAGSAMLFHWPLTGWMFFFPLFGSWLAGAGGWGVWLRNGLAALSAAILLGLVGLGLALGANLQALTGQRQFDWLVQSTSNWQALRPPVEAALAAQAPPPFLASNSWIDGALVHAAVRPETPVAVFSQDRRGFAYVLDLSTLAGRDAIFVTRRAMTANVLARLAGDFESFEPIGTVAVPSADNPVLRLELTLARNYRGAAR